MPDQISFDSPRRQSLLGVVVYMAKNGRALLSAFIVFWATSDKIPAPQWVLVAGIILIVLLIVGVSYLQYLNFTFHIENNELIVKSGVVFKERRIIPFERIQSVHTHQNIVQQILNVTALKVDSAGSKGKELEIPALDQPTANALQAQLKNAPDVSAPSIESASNSDAAATPIQEERIPLLRLDIIDLVKIGLTENHIRSGLLAVAIVYGYYSQYSEYVGEYVDTDVENYLPEVMRMGFVLVIAGAGIFLVASVVLSLVNTFLRYFDFRAWLETSTININSGLLKRNQYKVPVNKVQYLIWKSNPLRKLLNFETVSVKQAQSGEMKKKENISIPACKPEQTAALEKLLFGATVKKGTPHIHSNTATHLRVATYIIAVPVIIAMAILYFRFEQIYYPLFVFFPIAWFFAYKYAKSVGIEIQNDRIVVNQGWVFPRRIIFPLFKGQAVEFSQSIFLRRRGLANIRIFTAAGSITVRYLPSDLVEYLVDYSLYKVETHNGKWM